MASSIAQKSEKEILRLLTELGGKQPSDDSIVFRGKELVLPEGTTVRQNIKQLEKFEAQMEATTDFPMSFNYRPWDGAWCMWNAFKRTFGIVGHQGNNGFFGPEPPRMISIPCGVGETTQVPWGVFSLPVLGNTTFETFETQHEELGPLFAINAHGPKKYAGAIAGVFDLIERELKSSSLYRGKAFDGQTMPEFIDLSGVDPTKVVYSADVMDELEASVFLQLRNTEVFERRGVKLKRAVLMHGPFGTGKTLAAMITGQVATDNGWTFIKGRPGRDNLGFVMQTARLYQPSVVFYEDVDQVADIETASAVSISRLLDDFDGIEAKDTRIMCILTTNYADRITAGMARPGRLDAFIEINDLDLEGVEKLVRLNVGGAPLSDDVDWEQVFEASQGYMPAYVTEFAGRAWRYAFRRTGNENEMLVTEDIVKAANKMRPQYELQLKAKTKHVRPELDKVLQETVATAVRETVDEDYLVSNGKR